MDWYLFFEARRFPAQEHDKKRPDQGLSVLGKPKSADGQLHCVHHIKSGCKTPTEGTEGKI